MKNFVRSSSSFVSTLTWLISPEIQKSDCGDDNGYPYSLYSYSCYYSLFQFSFFLFFFPEISLPLEYFCCTLWNSGPFSNIPETSLGDKDD